MNESIAIDIIGLSELAQEVKNIQTQSEQEFIRSIAGVTKFVSEFLKTIRPNKIESTDFKQNTIVSVQSNELIVVLDSLKSLKNKSPVTKSKTIDGLRAQLTEAQNKIETLKKQGGSSPSSITDFENLKLKYDESRHEIDALKYVKSVYEASLRYIDGGQHLKVDFNNKNHVKEYLGSMQKFKREYDELIKNKDAQLLIDQAKDLLDDTLVDEDKNGDFIRKALSEDMYAEYDKNEKNIRGALIACLVSSGLLNKLVLDPKNFLQYVKKQLALLPADVLTPVPLSLIRMKDELEKLGEPRYKRSDAYQLLLESSTTDPFYTSELQFKNPEAPVSSWQMTPVSMYEEELLGIIRSLPKLQCFSEFLRETVEN